MLTFAVILLIGCITRVCFVLYKCIVVKRNDMTSMLSMVVFSNSEETVAGRGNGR